jgi:hypothetical protein
MMEDRGVCMVLVGNLNETDQRGMCRLEITFRWIFRKWDVGVWNGFGWLTKDTVGGQS